MGPRANKRINRSTMTEKKRRQWNAREKIAIIMYHENGHSKRKTADKFNIQAKQLRDWISKKPQLLKVQPGVKRLNIGVKPKYPALETALVTWVKEKRKNQNAVTRSMIQIKAQTLAQQRQWQVMCSGIRSFRFSNKWLDGFMSRNKLSNRRRTTIA
jgi:transposase-like protein